MKSRIIKKEKNLISIYIDLLFLLFTILLVLKGTPFFYVIVLLTISSNYKERTYALVNFVSIIIAFIISINKGYEMCIICASFFLFKIFSNFFIKSLNIKRMLPYILTNLIVFTIYFIPSISFVNFTNLLFSFSFSFLLFYAFHKILSSYQYSINTIDSKDRIIIYTIFPFLFDSISYFYLFFIRLIHIILIKSAKFSEALSAVILMSFFLIYFYNVSQIEILLLVIPFLFTFLLVKKYKIIVYCISYILSCIFILDNFYVSPSFYQGLISIIVSCLIPEEFYIKLNSILIKEDEEEKNVDTDKIDNIINYLTLVLDSRLEYKNDPLDKIYKELRNDLCKDCINNEKCDLKEIIKNGIKNKYEKDERKVIVDKCIYPYKLFKRTLIFNEIYKKEEKKNADEIENKSLYLKELENLYYPLKENKINNNSIDEIKKELKEEGIDLLDLKKYASIVEAEVLKYHVDDEEIILSVIENNYKKSFIFLDKKYSFSLGGYILSFSCKQKYNINIEYFKKGLLKNISGDNLIYFIDNNEFKLFLSDGMGHDKNSEVLSNYLLDSLIAYSKIDNNYLRQLETINRLLYRKSNEEMYATLDYFILDLVSLKFTLFKAGSFPTFIYHDGKLKESKRNFAPLGILEKIEPFAYKDVLSDGDIVIFMSDGFGNDVSKVIEEVIIENYNDDLEKLTSKIKDNLLISDKTIDDKTLVLIRIEIIK